MERIPLTPRGKTLLEEKLQHLKTVERPQNIRDIEEARAHGDLSENAEYQYAKEKQGFIDGEIKRTEDMLGRAEVIDPKTIKSSKIVFGATVTLLDTDEDKEITYQIVGPPEADLKLGLLSITSPIAKALIGRSQGDEVEVPTPNGKRTFEILKILFK